MDLAVKVGQTLTFTDPDTDEAVTVRVDAAENGQTKLTVLAPPEVSVGKVREPQSRTLH